jgi:hypothetical protein
MACTQRTVDLLRHSVLLQPTSTSAVLPRPIVAHNCHSLYLAAQSNHQHTKTIQNDTGGIAFYAMDLVSGHTRQVLQDPRNAEGSPYGTKTRRLPNL